VRIAPREANPEVEDLGGATEADLAAPEPGRERTDDGADQPGPHLVGTYFFLVATCLAVTAACFLRLVSSVLLCF
jgi:hypothetical protein